MNQKDYFVVGCKLFGIWCFVLFLQYFFRIFPDYVLVKNIPDDIADFFRITRLFEVLKPIVLFALGVYLIRFGRFVHRLAYPGELSRAKLNRMDSFILALKILGMYLIIANIPYLLEILSRYILYTNSPKYMSTTNMKEYVIANVLPTLGALILGFYLVKGGNFFVRIGSEKAGDNKSSTEEKDAG